MHQELKILTARIESYNPCDPDAYRKENGFRGLEKALKMRPRDVVEEVAKSGLRGRGGAGFPVARKWAGALASEQLPKYLVCNGDEGEFGTFKDKVLLEKDPWGVLEGMLIAAYAIGASRLYIYLKCDYTNAFDLWTQIAAKAEGAGLFKDLERAQGIKNETGIQFRVVRGRGLYIAGEEMALISSLCAARPTSSPKPPFPTQQGIFGRPTVVQNVETLVNVPFILARGAAEYRRIGQPDESGTRLYSLSGDVKRPGVYELPIGEITIRELIEQFGQGTPEGELVKAVQPGGGTSALLAADLINCRLSSSALAAAGSSAGTGAVIVYSQRWSALNIVKKLMDYYGHESCGRCMPCRIGTLRITELLQKLSAGIGARSDIQLLKDAAQTCIDASLCGMGQNFSVPVVSALKLFPEDFESCLRENGASAV